MPMLSDLKANRNSLLNMGLPKSGKSTFAYSAPTPILSFNYDGGSPAAPPGVDASKIFVQNYPIPEQQVNDDSDKWERVSNVAKQIINDIKEVNLAFREKRPIQIRDCQTGETVSIGLPATIILDGCVELYDHIGYWVLAVNKKRDFTEFANKFEGYGKRLDVLKRLYNMILPLPCVKIFNTWEKVTDPDSPTSDIVPDLGGKMDTIGPGKVDAVVRCYTANGKYLIDTRPNGRAKCLGVRGVYNLPTTIDVTLSGNGSNHKQSTPWQLLWGTK
jgi:AAA domain-containing protein